MKLALSHVESTTLTYCRTQCLSQPQPLGARHSRLVRATGTWARHSQPMVVDLDPRPPCVVYRWSDVAVLATGKGTVIGGPSA